MANIGTEIVRWFDTERNVEPNAAKGNNVSLVRCLPFLTIHAGCGLVLIAGWSPIAVVVCLLSFWLRMFAITAFYHRFFSHRSYQASRRWQFVFAILGNTAAQRGPLWWASHHRQHHKLSDKPGDLHSPIQNSFLQSHIGWFMGELGFKTHYESVKDLNRYPELRFLNRFDALVPLMYAGLMYALGSAIGHFFPETGTSGLQMLTWGFFISTVILFHATFTINSLGHIWGSRRYDTEDQSRNNAFLALLTLGEGWHNNHHRFSTSARQGFFWYELDITYLILKMMSKVGIVSNLRPVPVKVLNEAKCTAQESRR